MSASSQNSSAVPAAPPLSTLPLLHPSLSRLLEKSFPVAIQKVLPSVLQSAQLLSPEDFARILTGADLLKKLVSEQLEVELKKIVPEWILPVYVASFDAQWAAFQGHIDAYLKLAPITTKLQADFRHLLSTAVLSPGIEHLQAADSLFSVEDNTKQLHCTIPGCESRTTTLQSKGNSIDWSNVKRHFTEHHQWSFPMAPRVAVKKRTRDADSEAMDAADHRPVQVARQLPAAAAAGAVLLTAPVPASPPSSSSSPPPASAEERPTEVNTNLYLNL